MYGHHKYLLFCCSCRNYDRNRDLQLRGSDQFRSSRRGSTHLRAASLRIAENRKRLALDTAAYFDRLSPEAVAEEAMLASFLTNNVRRVDLDQEP